MDSVISSLNSFRINLIDFINIPKPMLPDIIEIIIIAFVLYELLVWVKNTRGWALFKGVVVILLFVLLAYIFELNTILWLAEKMVSIGIMAIVVIFQPELRKALEQLGRKQFLSNVFIFDSEKVVRRYTEKTISEIVKATFSMAKVKTGALIILEKDEKLTDYEKTGIYLDSIVTSQLLVNIFEKNTPLHDGAVIVRDDRVVAATCYLPLTDNGSLDKEMGTRHRAAIGISEVSDSLTIVVSEETGGVSVACGGEIERGINAERLAEILNGLSSSGATKRKFNFKNFIKGGKRDVEKDSSEDNA